MLCLSLHLFHSCQSLGFYICLPRAKSKLEAFPGASFNPVLPEGKAPPQLPPSNSKPGSGPPISLVLRFKVQPLHVLPCPPKFLTCKSTYMHWAFSFSILSVIGMCLEQRRCIKAWTCSPPRQEVLRRLLPPLIQFFSSFHS